MIDLITRVNYLRGEESLLLLELLKSNTSLHHLGGVVDLSVLDDLEAVVDHALEGGVALAVSGEGAALEESSEELLEHNELGEVTGEFGESLELGLALGLDALELGLHDVSGQLQVSQEGLVHDGLDRHVVELLGGEGLYNHKHVRSSQ